MLLDSALNPAKIGDKAAYGLAIYMELDSADEAQALCGLYGHSSSNRRTVFPQGHNHPVSSTPALWLNAIVISIHGSKTGFVTVEEASQRINNPDYLCGFGPV